MRGRGRIAALFPRRERPLFRADERPYTRRVQKNVERGARMKIVVNVECSPQEARAFLGLPDVAPMQEALMKEVEERMRESLRAMTPEAMAQTWVPLGAQSVEQWQKMFWGQTLGAAAARKS